MSEDPARYVAASDGLSLSDMLEQAEEERLAQIDESIQTIVDEIENFIDCKIAAGRLMGRSVQGADRRHAAHCVYVARERLKEVMKAKSIAP